MSSIVGTTGITMNNGTGTVILSSSNPTWTTHITGLQQMSKKRNFTLSFEETENGFVLNTTENKFNSDYNQYQQISKKFVFNDTNELIKAVSDVIRNKQQQ